DARLARSGRRLRRHVDVRRGALAAAHVVDQGENDAADERGEEDRERDGHTRPRVVAVNTIRTVSDDEADLIRRLRAGDEGAFMMLVEMYGPLMLRIALNYVRSRAVAEDVVQEAWLGVLNGIDRFEGRSSLKTWILRILVNRARTRGEREARSVPLSS